MIIGAHSILYSQRPEADRAFLRDVLGFPHVDVGEGWLIFGLPPSEVAVHPSEENDIHEFYLMCHDVEAFVGHLLQLGTVVEHERMEPRVGDRHRGAVAERGREVEEARLERA